MKYHERTLILLFAVRLMQLLHFPDKPHLQNLLKITLGRDNLKEAIWSEVFFCKSYLNNHKINFMSRKIFHLHCQDQLMLRTSI